MFRRITLAIVLLGPLEIAATAQPCNPVVDGTYCASQAGRSVDSAMRTTSFTPIQGIGQDLSTSREDPVTFGAVTFRGDGTKCIGLLTRGNCK